MDVHEVEKLVNVQSAAAVQVNLEEKRNLLSFLQIIKKWKKLLRFLHLSVEVLFPLETIFEGPVNLCHHDVDLLLAGVVSHGRQDAAKLEVADGVAGVDVKVLAIHS